MARGSVRANRRPYLRSSNLFSANAVIFPFLLVVFLVSHDKSDKDFLLTVKDLRDQPISVPLDIENRASANRIGMRIIDSHLRQVGPTRSPRSSIPVVKRLRGIRVRCGKSDQRLPANDSHVL